MKMHQKAPLPIDQVLPELRRHLQHSPVVLLIADPGAGKTTRVPLALMDERWLGGQKIVMLEPRRLAARRAAAYMAEMLEEEVGERIGFRIRGEQAVGPATRIEIVTEGILTRMIQDDPSLPHVGMLVFDEFHERSMYADLGLALALDVQTHLRSDLRIVMMSATLDDARLQRFFGDAPIVKSEGTQYPVATRYATHKPKGDVERVVASTVVRALETEEGDVLVFLAGQREIRRVKELLLDARSSGEVIVHELYSDAPAEQQRAALAPAPSGKRKVILSTNIAETSVTIDGVRVVIDSGWTRTVRFDPRRGMSGLVTVPVSQAGADQRRGRAGRQEPGVCYRLWTEQQHGTLPKVHPPEILSTDLTPLALALAQWGDPHAEHLRFLDRPPAAHLSQARSVLISLGALDREGRLTVHGKDMAALPVHPRLAHMMLCGKQRGYGTLACEVAALLEERDLLRNERTVDIDFAARWHLLNSGAPREAFALERIRRQAQRYREMIGAMDDVLDESKLGMLLALAYPERIAKQREWGSGRYQLSNGTGAMLPKGSFLARETYLAVADVDGVGSEVRILLAAPLTESDIVDIFSDQLITQQEVQWDETRDVVTARRVVRLGAIELSHIATTPPRETVRTLLLSAIHKRGLDVLPWTKAALSIRTRSEWLRARGLVDANWPILSDEHLRATLHTWLGPFVDGISSFRHLQHVDLSVVLRALFSPDQWRSLERLAPLSLTVPTGSRIPLDYSTDPPVLAVRLQEMFGERETPTVAAGKVKVQLQLLSPARRPLAVTQDLRSFWQDAYIHVRKEMRGQYPKHFWPENPLEAQPTKHTKSSS